MKIDFDDVMGLGGNWEPYLPAPTMPFPVTTEVRYSQKDIDEAYCRGYNKALSERSEVPTGITTHLTGSKSVTFMCGKCMNCNRVVPYADYCMRCGAKILYGGKK